MAFVFFGEDDALAIDADLVRSVEYDDAGVVKVYFRYTDQIFRLGRELTVREVVEKIEAARSPFYEVE